MSKQKTTVKIKVKSKKGPAAALKGLQQAFKPLQWSSDKGPQKDDNNA